MLSLHEKTEYRVGGWDELTRFFHSLSQRQMQQHQKLEEHSPQRDAVRAVLQLAAPPALVSDIVKWSPALQRSDAWELVAAPLYSPWRRTQTAFQNNIVSIRW